MEFLKQNWQVLLFAITMGMVWLYCINEEKKRDALTNYSEKDLKGKLYKFENGVTWLTYKYEKKTQTKKKQHILKTVLQDSEITDEYGYVYKVSELVSDEYYFSNDTIISKKGPYIVYKMIPITEVKQADVIIKDVNGPVQVATGDSSPVQNFKNVSFSYKIKEYKDLMIKNGIPEEDINAVLNNPDDIVVKKNFLSTYRMELAEITVNITGILVNLFSLFNS